MQMSERRIEAFSASEQRGFVGARGFHSPSLRGPFRPLSRRLNGGFDPPFDGFDDVIIPAA